MGSAGWCWVVRRRKRRDGDAHLLHAVPDRRQLVGEVRAASVGGVLRTGKWHERETGVVGGGLRRPGTHEVALNDEREAAAHDAVAVLPANNKGNVGTSTQGLRNSMQLSGGTYRRSEVCMRDTPSYGTRCIRRTSNLTSSHSTTCEQRDAAVSMCGQDLGQEWGSSVPSWAHRALDLEERESNARLPVLGRLRKAQAREGEPRRIGEIGSWNLGCGKNTP